MSDQTNIFNDCHLTVVSTASGSGDEVGTGSHLSEQESTRKTPVASQQSDCQLTVKSTVGGFTSGDGTGFPLSDKESTHEDLVASQQSDCQFTLVSSVNGAGDEDGTESQKDLVATPESDCQLAVVNPVSGSGDGDDTGSPLLQQETTPEALIGSQEGYCQLTVHDSTDGGSVEEEATQPPLPVQESTQELLPASQSSPKTKPVSQKPKKKAAGFSRAKAICAVMTTVIVVGVIVLFYYLLIGEVKNITIIQFELNEYAEYVEPSLHAIQSWTIVVLFCCPLAGYILCMHTVFIGQVYSCLATGYI